MKKRTSLVSLRQINKKYWQTVTGEKTPEYKRGQVVKSRKRYLQLLRSKIPFLKKILDPKKQKKITVIVDGKNYYFTLLGTGFDMKVAARPAVILLDGTGKKYLFYRSTGINSKKPGEWLPFNSIKVIKRKDGSSYGWYEKFEGHPNFPELFVKLGEKIKELEPEIEFVNASTPSSVNAINDYL
ncbi:hypothetical protein KKG83_05625 [Candidatus Micrarchaeota archaeon]|nr:hypothetical protein [Candidatus Micrarchaeota archaeon]MBU2476923.1 hypothetical protein [Candidatus Micrarchaeota archaeon]